ncbi:hypothetical protein [Propionicicella superfundia]|uniref:hypothetical protein n=1 Tax=Propionicicella superfundia TaxID=348582 RepID=UPI0012EBEE11|nr:hypothetical protein [Propionicicella superfundia]
MTSPANAVTATPPGTSSLDPRVSGVLRWLPAVLAAVAVVLLARAQQVPVTTSAWYGLVFAWSVVVPGMLVFRLLRGRPSTLLADVVLGGATGLILNLLAWALFTAVGLQSWLAAWPLLVVVPCAAVPRLRPAWTLTRYERRLNPATSLVLAVAAVWSARGSMGVAAASPVPPAAGRWFQDLYWHLALVAELKRSVLPTDPQVVGEPLSYHWFADAHIAAMTWSTGLDTPLVLTRLWAVPIVVLTVLGLAVVGQHLTGRAWPGALASVMAVVAIRIQATWYGYTGASAFVAFSPSQDFSGPFLLLALVPLIDILRGRRVNRGSWVLLALALLSVAGAKASVLPVLVCGLALAAFVALVANRALVRGSLAALALTVAALAVTWPLVAGGGGGSSIQLFSTVRALPPWKTFAGSPLSLGILPPGMGRPGAWTLLAVVMIGWAVSYGWALLGLPALSRRDLSGWALLGTGVGGLAAMLLINQDGLSQVYFMASALLCWYLFAAWGFSVLVRRAAATAPWPAVSLVVAGLAAGGVAGMWGRSLVAPISDPADLSAGIALALLPWSVGLLSLLIVLVVLRRRPVPRLFVGLVGCAVLLGAGLAARLGPRPTMVATVVAAVVFVGAVILAVVTRGGRPPSPRRFFSALVAASSLVAGVLGVVAPVAPAQGLPRDDVSVVTQDEASAAVWLRGHSDPRDVVATNVHCLEKVTTEDCDARGFWVSALAERRVHIGGWAYTGEARQRHGVNGLAYKRQPFHDPARFAQNDAVFTSPTADGIERLRAAGVRFLYADELAGPVSPRLADLADLVHTEGPVSIYEL